MLASLERRGPSDPVFWNKLTRRPLRSIESFWFDVRAEANLPGVRLHDLRHSFASHAAARSETLPMIGKLLGHSKIATTSRYAHLDDGHVLDAAERIGELIAAAMGEIPFIGRNTMCDIEARSMTGKPRTRIYKIRWFAKFANRETSSPSNHVTRRHWIDCVRTSW